MMVDLYGAPITGQTSPGIDIVWITEAETCSLGVRLTHLRIMVQRVVYLSRLHVTGPLLIIHHYSMKLKFEIA